MLSDDQLRDAMAKTMTSFAAVVAALDREHWDLPSPCTGWSVFDVVDHVVAGERFTVAVLAGASLAEATEAQAGLDSNNLDSNNLDSNNLDSNNKDAVRQVTDAADAALAAFDGSLDRIVQHRVGSISARRMLGFRIIDQLGHTWDVATAAGQPVALDPDALAVGVEIALAERKTLEGSPNFATSPHDGVETGDPLTTFLQAIGRASSDD